MYLVGLKKNIEVDPNSEEVKDAGTNIVIYTISVKYDYLYGRYVRMHGPMEYTIQEDDITSYACAYRNEAKCHGISLVYTQDNTTSPTSSISCWVQNDKTGMIINDVSLLSNVVATSDEVIGLRIKFQNIGYAIERYVSFLIESVNEETGERETLQQVKQDYKGDWIDIPSYYDYEMLYTGDYETLLIYCRTSNNWDPNKEYRIDVKITSDPYDNSNITLANPIDDPIIGVSSSKSINISNSYLVMNGKLSLINGKHVAELSIENKSYYGVDEPHIVVLAVYDDCDENYSNERNVVLGNSSDLLSSYNSNISKLYNTLDTDSKQAQTYNLSVDLEDIFINDKENVKGVEIYLVDKDGNQIDNSCVEFDNPYYVHPQAIITPDTSTK